MASEVTNYKCPACTGPLRFDGTTGKLQCDYCGGSYEVAQIEEMMAKQSEAAAAVTASGNDNHWNVSGESWGSDAQGMKSYSCPSCGAELICDATTAATCCPYCGNQTIVPGQFSGSLKPEFVIPFKTSKDQAKAALQNHYKGKRLLPKQFVEGNHIEEIQGVYVPFWMFDCEALGSMRFETTSSTKEIEGDKEITTTQHYEVERSGSLSFRKVPVDASTKMPDGHMDSIEPYDYKELKPFSMAYMPGFLADKYDVEAQECGSRMEERCKKTFEDEVSKTVEGYDTKSVKERDIRVKKGDVHYAMLPVWLLATKWKDQNFLFAMNGQTGKMVGNLPLDKKKYWMYFGGISAILIAVAMLYNFNIAETTPTVSTLVCWVLFMIFMAFLIVSSMKAKLRSIGSQKAGSYIAGGGLKLTHSKEIFIRTTKSVKTVKREPEK